MTAPVAAIVPAYRSRPWIRGAIESILAQTRPPAEIAVVDDGSDDGLEEELEPFLDRVLYVRRDNAGPAAARNLGVRLTAAPYLAFLDADDLWEPERLAAQVPILDEDPDCVLVCADAWELAPGEPPVRFSQSHGRSGPPRLDLEGLLAANGVAILTVLCRRSAFEAAGGFDEDRRLIAVEDYDLWLRMRSLGSFRYVDRPLARYRRRRGSLSGAARFRAGVDLVLDKFLLRERPGPALRRAVERRRAALRLDEARELQDLGRVKAAWRPIREALLRTPADPAAWRLLARGLALAALGPARRGRPSALA